VFRFFVGRAVGLMHNGGTISVRAVAKIAEAARGAGVAPEDLYRAVGFDPALLGDPDDRMPYAQLVRMYEQAARLTGDEAFGLHLSERTSLKVFDVLSYVFINSPTLGEALRRAVRYHSIWNDGAWITSEQEGGAVRLRYHYLSIGADGCRQDCEMTLCLILRAGRVLTGVEWTPAEVSFRHAEPPDTSEHRRVFGCPVHFSRPFNEIVFDASLLGLPVTEADPALCAVLERHAEELLARSPRRGGLAREVRRLLSEALRGGDPGLDAVARRLGLSARTLQRKLKEEGTSHQELLEEMRRDLSERYLREPRMAICEVAYLLGFSEPSAFHRAFRRRTGTTPARFRQARIEESGA
jgi:AraC-like DNA-binding protein